MFFTYLLAASLLSASGLLDLLRRFSLGSVFERLLTVEEEGKENLGPDMAGVLGGKVEKDGVVEAREVEREEWKGEVRLSFSWIFCFINTFTQIRHSPSPGLSRRDSISSQLFSPLRETDISFPGTASKVL